MAPARPTPARRPLLAAALLLAGAGAQAAPDAAAPASATAGFATLSLVLFERGPHWSADEGPEAEARQAAHLAHLERMWTEGHAEVCGPVAGDDPHQTLRGICLYRGPRAEALALAAADPAVASGHLQLSVHDWSHAAGMLAFPQRQAGAPPPAGPHKAAPAHGGHGAHGAAPAHGGHHDDRATVGHRFDDPEKWSKIFDDPARDAWQQPAALVAALAIPKKATVADIGAGTGYFNPHLAAAVGKKGRVIAVDVERSLVDHMTRRARAEATPQVRPRLGTYDDPGLLLGEADLILMVDTYHHIDHRRDYFAQLRAALAPGGRLVIVDFKQGELPVGPPPSHRIPPDQVERELADAGYTLVDAPAVLPHQFVRVFTAAP